MNLKKTNSKKIIIKNNQLTFQKFKTFEKLAILTLPLVSSSLQ